MRRNRKICAVITARPSYSRIKTVLRALRDDEEIELQLIVSGSALLDRYGKVIEVLKQDGFEPDAEVYMVVEGGSVVTSAKSTGMAIIELSTIFASLKPDLVLTVADRYETLATAIAASYLHIPLAHIQGGEVTGSIDEKVRHSVTKLSDIHCVSNSSAAARVSKMGEAADKIFVTGCPSIDLAKSVSEDPMHFDLAGTKVSTGVGADVDVREPYVMVMQHPVTTNWGEAERQVLETLDAIDHLNTPALWFWPNIDAGSDSISRAIRRAREKGQLSQARFIKNVPPEEFLALLQRTECLIGNSSVGIRESSFLGTPVVNIGDRQIGRDRADNVMDVGYCQHEILSAIDQQRCHGKFPASALYGDGDAGHRILDVLKTTELTAQKILQY